MRSSSAFVVVLWWFGVYHRCSKVKVHCANIMSHLSHIDWHNISVNMLKAWIIQVCWDRWVYGGWCFCRQLNSLGEEMTCLPILSMKWYLSWAYRGQVNIRWLMSSVACTQVNCAQYSVPHFHILWRCLLIGTWPVRNWVSPLPLHGRVLRSTSPCILPHHSRFGTPSPSSLLRRLPALWVYTVSLTLYCITGRNCTRLYLVKCYLRNIVEHCPCLQYSVGSRS